jgi:hypothetical protein
MGTRLLTASMNHLSIHPSWVKMRLDAQRRARTT